ncbi:hypothetical protein BDD12DRAFT_980068, partial [Trichophaea hybrida]
MPIHHRSRRGSASSFKQTPPTHLFSTVKSMQCHLRYVHVRDQDRPWNPHSPIPFPEREDNLLKVFNRLRIQLLADNTEEQQDHYFSKIHSAPTTVSLSIQSQRSNPSFITSGSHQRSGYLRDSGSSSNGDRSSSQQFPTSNGSGTSNSGEFTRSSGSTALGGHNEREGKDEDADSVEGGGDCSSPSNLTERGFKCPVIEKSKRVQEMPKECKTVFRTQQAVREHAQKYHLACPICLHDPVMPRERTHSSKLTKGKTLKDTYFHDQSYLISHICTHLKCLPCKNGCGNVFSRENDRKAHHSSCKSKSSGSGREHLIPQNLKTLVEETKKCTRLSRAEMVRKLEGLLLLQADPAGKRIKIYDAHDGTNNLDKLSTFSTVISPETNNTCPDGPEGDTIGEMFVRASQKSQDKEKFTLQFLSKLGKDDRHRIQTLSNALNDSSKKRSPSPTWYDEDPIATQATKRLDRSHCRDTGKDFPSHLSPTESLFPQLEDQTYCRNESTDTRSEMSSRR